MYNVELTQLSKTERENLFMETIKGYLDAHLPSVSNLANFSAIVKAFHPDLNWAGFYLYDGEKLVLGPFQGLPACTEIQLGKGVCGTAAKTRFSLIVSDTAKFPGHIVCDRHSCSELVVPIVKDNELYGVLDLDSPDLDHFQESDRIRFENAVNLLIDIL